MVTELVVITDVVEALEVELDEETDVVAMEFVLELALVSVVVMVEFAVAACSGDSRFGDTCKVFSEPRTVV
jgi:hypothetical protein